MAVYLVRGSHASLYEYNTSLALNRLRVKYIFQYAPYGHYGRRGELYIDFLLFLPRPTALEIFGEHWHIGQLGADDQLRLHRIKALLGIPPYVFWGNEVITEQKALDTCRKKIGIAM